MAFYGFESSDRFFKQIVKINSSKSEVIDVHPGIGRDSILASLNFLVYFNDSNDKQIADASTRSFHRSILFINFLMSMYDTYSQLFQQWNSDVKFKSLMAQFSACLTCASVFVWCFLSTKLKRNPKAQPANLLIINNFDILSTLWLSWWQPIGI